MAAILVLHGPNLNLLGTREPEIYGSETLDEINHRLQSEAERAGASLTYLQSNSEQEMIEAIRAGDADRAEELAYLHSDEFRDRMKTFISGRRTSELSLGERSVAR